MIEKFNYATVKKIERACSLVENQMADTKLGNFKAIHDKVIGAQDPDIWIDRLSSNLRDLSRDIKQNPKIRGALLASFVCGDVQGIKKAYSKIRLSEKHFISQIPGVAVSFNGKISFINQKAASEQLRYLFVPVVIRLIENRRVGKIDQLP